MDLHYDTIASPPCAPLPVIQAITVRQGSRKVSTHVTEGRKRVAYCGASVSMLRVDAVQQVAPTCPRCLARWRGAQ